MDHIILHNKIENQLINYANNSNKIKIVKEGSYINTTVYISTLYHVNYLNRPLFEFSMKTFKKLNNTIIEKNNFTITSNESIQNFINIVINFSIKLFENYEKINKNFYIDKPIIYYDIIIIKKPFSHIFYKIITNMNGKYILTINDDDDNFIEYYDIEQVINSDYINELHRTPINNFFRMIKLI